MAKATPPPSAPLLLRPFLAFIRAESAGGFLLLGCAVLALVLANSPLAGAYFDFWQTPVVVGVGSFAIDKPLLLWVNDGLMAIFFFLIGLEIKREVLAGELSNPRQAALALVGAVGGMAVPALLYVALNVGGPTASGWGIPMATDIAFALGVLTLLGSRVPLALKVFLTALAIVDDLGAVLVIALFYTAELNVGALALAAGVLVALVGLNRAGARRPWPYVLLGIVLWVAFLKSGVHATVAGVLLALTIPVTRRIDAPKFLADARAFLDIFAADTRPDRPEPTADQRDAVLSLEQACEDVETPLQRLEHDLHAPVAFFVMPVFALANAGVAVTGDLGTLLGSPVLLGVVLGLVVGKPLGVFTLAWLAVRTGLASLPAGVSWRQLLGVSALCGIGFTMAIFIATLAFPLDPALLDSAKLGILIASAISGVLGWLLLMRAPAPPPGVPTEPVPEPAEAA